MIGPRKLLSFVAQEKVVMLTKTHVSEDLFDALSLP